MEFTDPFLVQMQDHIKSKVSAREAHTKARDVILQSGIPINMYHISNVFKALEEYVVVVPERINEDSLYYVTSDDLGTLIQALDNMADPDTGCLNLSTEIFYKMSVTIRPSHGISPDGKDLDRVHEEVMLKESRRMLYCERLCADRNRRGGAANQAASQHKSGHINTSRNISEDGVAPAATVQTGSDNISAFTPLDIPESPAQTSIKVEPDSAASDDMDMVPTRSRRGETPLTIWQLLNYPHRTPDDLVRSVDATASTSQVIGRHRQKEEADSAGEAQRESHRATTNRPAKRVKREAESHDGGK